MTLIDLMTKFGTEDRCRDILERLRWPEGVICSRCKHNSIMWLEPYNRYECNQCHYQFTVTAGTIFNDTHLPLIKWFVATFLICESRKGYSANQMKRTVGVSYKTAWYLCHRIRAAMRIADKTMLDGNVEMDETYIGGKMKGGKRGRGSENKEIVVAIRQRGGELRFFHANDVKSGTLAQYIKENVSQDVEVLMTDELTSYPPAMRQAGVAELHKTVEHGKGVYVVGDVHTNSAESAFSLLKRGIVGTWHKISAKHLPAYLDEMTFRFNRRKSDVLFLDTLRHMVTADPLTFAKLTA